MRRSHWFSGRQVESHQPVIPGEHQGLIPSSGFGERDHLHFVQQVDRSGNQQFQWSDSFGPESQLPGRKSQELVRVHGRKLDAIDRRSMKQSGSYRTKGRAIKQLN